VSAEGRWPASWVWQPAEGQRLADSQDRSPSSQGPWLYDGEAKLRKLHGEEVDPGIIRGSVVCLRVVEESEIA
jgi:hypothetical protein